MKPAVTIDKLDLKEHLRWAQDQEILETSFVSEAHLVAPHPEILGMSMIYSSEFEELFELQKRNQHWASFSPPNNFQVFRKRFFSYQLFPSINCEEETSQENGEETSQENQETEFKLISVVTQLKALGGQKAALFERDKSAMLNLLESMKWLNNLLKQINGKKLQYQKG